MEKYFIAAITSANHIGTKRLQRLVQFFGNGKNAWNAEDIEIAGAGLPKNATESLLEFRKKNPDKPKEIQEFCEKNKIGLCSLFEENYPPLLKEISSPPAVFYYRGNLQPFAERIAIVGTRENTTYGRRVALDISAELAAAGLTVVSGAARGIDRFAHKGAMKTGRTVAVLGSGINFADTPERQKFLDSIVESGGLLLSEFEINLTPNEGTFPARNRIIAGLSKGIIVVEAADKSGALITAEQAANFGRDVFAVPNHIYAEKSEGCLNLIRDGAILIKGAKQVLDFYKLAPKSLAGNLFENILEESSEGNSQKILLSPQLTLDETEKKVFNLIPLDETISVDEILMREDELAPNEISEILLRLEVKNLIQQDENGNYFKC